MPLLPENWRVHEGRDPDKELQQIQRRFEAIRRRADRRARMLKTLREARAQLLTASLVFAATFVLAVGHAAPHRSRPELQRRPLGGRA